MAQNRFIRTGGGFQREQTTDRFAFIDPVTGLRTNTPPVSQETVTPTALTGRTEALLPSGTVTPETSPAPLTGQNPFDNFNLLLLDALKKSQGVDTLELRKRQRALQRASLGRTSETTPEELRTLSPEQQSKIRTGNISALSPDIDEASFQLAKAESTIANFERVFEQANKLGEEFKENMLVPPSVIESYKLAIEANPDNLSTLLSTLNDKSRQKVIESLDFSKLKSGGAGFTLGKDQIRFSESGEEIARGIAGDTGGVDGELTNPEFASIVESAAGLLGAERGKASRIALTDALNNEDYVTAYAQIANNVEQFLTGDSKKRFANVRTDYRVMIGMRDAIQEYADAGGELGFLKGKVDSIAKNFGQLKTDPEFAALGVQLEREFQAYRNIMTGAAFSPAESAEYAKVNPRSGASLDLNLATIDGALAALENRAKSTINSRVPGAQRIFDLAVPSQETTTPTLEGLGVSANEEALFDSVVDVNSGTTAEVADNIFESFKRGLGF